MSHCVVNAYKNTAFYSCSCLEPLKESFRTPKWYYILLLCDPSHNHPCFGPNWSALFSQVASYEPSLCIFKRCSIHYHLWILLWSCHQWTQTDMHTSLSSSLISLHIPCTLLSPHLPLHVSLHLPSTPLTQHLPLLYPSFSLLTLPSGQRWYVYSLSESQTSGFWMILFGSSSHYQTSTARFLHISSPLLNVR